MPPVSRCQTIISTTADIWSIASIHKSLDASLHLGVNKQVQNTFLTERQERCAAGKSRDKGIFGMDMIDSQGQRPSNFINQFWSAMLASTRYPVTQTLIYSVTGHAKYIKPRPLQFLLPTCTTGHAWKWQDLCVNYFIIKIVLLLWSRQANIHYRPVNFHNVVWPNGKEIGEIVSYFVGTSRVINVRQNTKLRLTSNILNT